MRKFNVVSLFAGCGGLDLGFRLAGFKVPWANEYDRSIWETYEYNHPSTFLDRRSILKIPSDEIPSAEGIIGGPPCQSWSLAGAMRGVKDPRGKLFYEYIRVLRDKRPLFFLAENVPGIISSAHIEEFRKIIGKFEDIGYTVRYKLLNAKNFGVPQERHRVIIIGYSKLLGIEFNFPSPTHFDTDSSSAELFPTSARGNSVLTLRDAIGDLPVPRPALDKNKTNGDRLDIANHEYMNGGFSTIFMSRNRKKEWDEPSFTIQAGGRHAPLFPASAKMIKLGEDEWKFDKKSKYPYRRLSVRECARVQTFPDDFIFRYNSVSDGYKMIGNAVPVKLANVIAKTILRDLSTSLRKR